MRVLRDKINDYEQSVNAILSFAAFVVYDGKIQRSESEFGIGRRMTTSSDNPIAPNSNITPDLVVQKSLEYGCIVEAKKALDKNQANWVTHLEQLRKYDDGLQGWWTVDGKIPHYDAVMLIHQSRGRPFVNFLKNQKEVNPDMVGPNSCVVEFNHSGETVAYYFLRLEFGKINDNELGESLENGINIPLDSVRMSFPNIQFYDDKPPLPWLLSILWTDIFPSKMEDGYYDEKTKTIKTRTTVAETTDELQKAFGSKALKQDSRAGEFPKFRWVKEAFERLVMYKLAIPITNEDDTYIIYYRSFRDDVLDRFIKFESDLSKSGKKKAEEINEKQILMFPSLDE